MTDRLTDAELAELERLRAGCSACDYDEAEGGLINHCSRCKHAITSWVWEHAPAMIATARRESEQAKRIERLERAMRIAVASHTLGCPCDLCQIIKEPTDADA